MTYSPQMRCVTFDENGIVDGTYRVVYGELWLSGYDERLVTELDTRFREHKILPGTYMVSFEPVGVDKGWDSIRNVHLHRIRDRWGERQRYYDKVQRDGFVKIPVGGNVHRVLRLMNQGVHHNVKLRKSVFTARELEQCLIFGFATHEYKKFRSYYITPRGMDA
jgi:hypothetical protein